MAGFVEEPEYRRIRLAELKRLTDGLAPGTKPDAMTDDIIISCPGNAEAVLERCKEVLRVVVAQDPERWPPTAQWRSMLPPWFVEACAPPMSSADEKQAVGQLRTLPWRNRNRFSALDRVRWPLETWLPWLQFRDGGWWWWEGKVESPSSLRISVMISGWPYGGDELLWLLCAAGATRAEKEI